VLTLIERELVLCEVRDFYDHDQAQQFLITPQPLLSGRRPLDCQFAEIMRLVDQLKSGAFI